MDNPKQNSLAGVCPVTAIIERPYNDDRLRINGKYIGCVTNENADVIMALQARVRRLEQALDLIAFGETSELSGNPLLWPSTVAYVSLGGRMDEGVREDAREDLLSTPLA